MKWLKGAAYFLKSDCAGKFRYGFLQLRFDVFGIVEAAGGGSECGFGAAHLVALAQLSLLP